MTPNSLKIDCRDNVVTVMADLAPDDLAIFATETSGADGGIESVAAIEPIPYGHKIALTNIEPGGSIVKYGAAIGTAITPVKRGSHVHMHNVRSARVGAPR